MVGTEGARRAPASSPRCCRPVPSTCPTGGGWSALVCNRRGQRGPGAAGRGGGEPARGNLGFCQSPPGAWKGLGALKAGGAEGGTTTTGRTLLAPPPDRGPRRARGLRERVRGSPWPGSGCRAGRPPRCAAGRGNRSHRPPGCTGSSPAWRRAGGRAAASGRGPAGHPRRQRPAPQSLGAERSRGKGPGLPVPEPGRVLNERPRLRAGPRPSPRRHWPEVPSCDGGGRRRRAGARPARGRPASAGPGPVAEGERHRLSGAVPGCSGAGVSRTERR